MLKLNEAENFAISLGYFIFSMSFPKSQIGEKSPAWPI
jgi:hypothetical protein